MPSFIRVLSSLLIGYCVLAWLSACATAGPATALAKPQDLEQSCQSGAAADCLALGLLYEDGQAGRAKDASRAASLYEQACTGGQARGCNALGTLYEEGRGVQQDPGHAARLYEQACSLSYANACFNLASLYLNGIGVAKDDSRAAKLFEKACRADQPEACFRLGTLYATGTGVQKDARYALGLMQKACTLGDTRGCSHDSPAETRITEAPEVAYPRTMTARPAGPVSASLHLVLPIGFQVGGDTLLKLTYTDGSTQDIDAGSAVLLAAGGLLDVGDETHALQIQATIGYNYTGAEASNGSVTWQRWPVELLTFYEYRPAHLRIGGGLQYQFGVSLGASGTRGSASVDFDNALGKVVQAEWLMTYLSVYARYTLIHYSLNGSSEHLSGNAFGFGLSFLLPGVR